MRNTTDGPNLSPATAFRLLAVTLLLALLAVISPAIASAQDTEPVEDPVAEEEPQAPNDPWELGFDPDSYTIPLVPQGAATGCVSNYGIPDDLVPLAPSTGTHRAGVLFVDYADFRATESTQAVMDRIWSETDEYLTSLSGDRISIDLIPHHGWVNLNGTEASYNLEDADSGMVNLTNEAVTAKGVNPANFDSFWIIQEKSAEWGGAFVYWLGNGQKELPFMFVGFGGRDAEPVTSEFDTQEATIAHEFLHTVGLVDLYDGSASSATQALQFVGNFSIMAVEYGFEGGTLLGAPSTKNGNELFAVEAWSLGWLNDSQIICADGLSTTERLSGASQGGAKALMVPVTSTKSIFIEVREQARWDADIEAEGVLVYEVDESIANAEGIVQVLGEYDGWWADGSVLLQSGEEMMIDDRWQVLVGATSNGRYNVTVNDFGMCNGLPVTINMNTPGVTGIGTEGDDVIMGTPGRDIINSLGGNDTVCSLDGVDWIDLGAGDDTAFAGLGTDAVWGRTGRDTIHGEGGSDYIWGGTAKDTIWAGSGADRVFGEDGPDTLNGMGGQDFMWGGEGDDEMQGNWQSDQMWGGPGNDTMRGAQGKDKLYGEEGNDDLFGGNNSDWLDGGPGIDTANGQTGRENPVIAGVQGCVAETTELC